MASPPFVIRPVVPTVADAEAINAIYNPYVATSPATFETEPVTINARLDVLARRLPDARYPAVIAHSGETPIGFASAAPFDERAAYGVSVKTSVFVADGATGGGVGRALYEALFARLAGADLHRAYGLIVAPNEPSVRLHRALGFEHLATLSEVGRKFGRYYDVMWFEKRLS